MALGSLICATRFKYYDQKGNLLAAVRPYCEGVDSFDHFLRRRRIPGVPRSKEDLVAYLKCIAYVLEPGSPALPLPIHPVTSDDLALGWLGSSDEELSLSMD